MDILADVLSQLTISKEVLHKNGYYDQVEDFKVKTTDSLVDDVKRYFKEEKGKGLSLGFESMDIDDKFLLRQGEVTILTGSSGSGKTTFLSQALLNIMKSKNVMVASMEMRPVIQVAKMMTQKGLTKPTDSDIEYFCANYKDKLWIFDADGVTSEKDINAALVYGKNVLKTEVFVIDSLMKIDSIAEDDYGSQKKFINKLSCLARDLKIHIFLVAHTRKLSDENVVPDASQILGSSHIRNLTDNIICLHRRKDIEQAMALGEISETENPNTSFLMIQKQRNHPFEGTFNLWFDRRTQTFKDNRG